MPYSVQFARLFASGRSQRWPLRSSSQVATWYYKSNHSKVKAIPFSALPKDTSELFGLSSHYPFHAEC